MCDASPPHGDDVPPLGESWCALRLDVEIYRWYSGYPMSCGPVKVNAQIWATEQRRQVVAPTGFEPAASTVGR